MNSAENILLKPIEYLKGVGPQRAELLQKELQIFRAGQLLFHYPFRYNDRTRIYAVRDINHQTQYIQLKGIITDIDIAGSGRNERMIANFTDATGSIELVWFKGVRWIAKNIVQGKEYILFGKPSIFKNRFNIAHPELEPADEYGKITFTGKMQPVYPGTDKLKQKNIDSKYIALLIQQVLAQVNADDIKEILPDYLIKKYAFPSRYEAVKQIHAPESEHLLAMAQKRLKYEELFMIQYDILSLKMEHLKTYAGYIFSTVGDYFNTFYNNHLPFQLTHAQKRVIKEIRKDTQSGKQMNRLIQGDVGSGKTIVALLCALLAADNSFQTALMAPTEILAQQHYRSLCEAVGLMNFKIELLTASVKGAVRKKILEELQDGKIHLLIGTHALIEDEVRYNNLGLVIIDEQHRFGVAQRAKLWHKNEHIPPHVLVMTATPIPRTLAMTIYGDLDVSVIDELPPGRKPISTMHRYENARTQVYHFIRDQINKGRQIYVVYPLIEESEKMDFKHLYEGFEELKQQFPEPQYRLCMVHGKMKNDERDVEMKRFLNKEAQIMVATTVIEVGVNVPNASVMIIESAERFGLSQLHQLRGRVGRGAEQSYCILLTDTKLSNEARRRMETMVRTNNGFEVADVDLEIRGPGDLSGTQQSGILNLKIADLVKDQELLQRAREDVQKILKVDAQLQNPEHQNLLRYVTDIKQHKQNWSKVS
jgi:ATP-dependent DNA helicase RecG